MLDDALHRLFFSLLEISSVWYIRRFFFWVTSFAPLSHIRFFVKYRNVSYFLPPGEGVQVISLRPLRECTCHASEYGCEQKKTCVRVLVVGGGGGGGGGAAPGDSLSLYSFFGLDRMGKKEKSLAPSERESGWRGSRREGKVRIEGQRRRLSAASCEGVKY